MSSVVLFTISGLPHACLARIRREPRPWTAKHFGAAEWLPDDTIDPMLLEMLPQGAREISAKYLATLENGPARGASSRR